MLDTAKELVKAGGQKLRLPVDVVIADDFANEAQSRTMDVGPVPEGWRILDIGPETVKRYSKVLAEAGTVVWNGPMGVFEMPNFAKGTEAVCSAVADATGHGAVSLVGGGDSAAAVKELGFSDRISHVSTGGGASLELISGITLPAVAEIAEKPCCPNCDCNK